MTRKPDHLEEKTDVKAPTDKESSDLQNKVGFPSYTSHNSPPTPASGASSHLSCQPQGLCTHGPPFRLPSSPQQHLPSLTSTPGPLHTLLFLHTTLQPFFTTITPTLLAPQNGIHPWGSQLTLHHTALSSASDSGSLFSVCLGIYFILPIRS